MQVELFTHKGWFGICPVYIGDLDTDAPRLTPRLDNAFGEFLFGVSHGAHKLAFTVIDALCPKCDPGFLLLVTEQLLVPYRYEFEKDEYE
jgi:hypothetical protein